MSESSPFICTETIQYIQDAILRDSFQIPWQNSWSDFPPTIQYHKTNNEIIILEQNDKNGFFFFFLWVFNLDMKESFEKTHKIYSILFFDETNENFDIKFENEPPFGIYLSPNNNENSIIIANENIVFG